MRQTFFSVLISILAISAVVNAETVQLSFSGVTTEGRYCLLDSVKIENLTQNWTQTLDCSIDTTYELPVAQAPMGIDNVAASNDGNGLLSVIQKFAINNTIVSINPIDNGVVRMRVFDMVGRVVIEHAEYLSAGQHQYILQLGAPQTYMISVVTDTEYASAKILNMASSGTYDLSRVASLPSMNQAQSRRNARAEGADLMQYTGYTNQKGVAVASEPITQYQSSPEQIVFHFSPVAKSEEGMYTAMIGFNSQLYQYSFDRLTSSNLKQHQNFVSNLSMASGTILYHAVYTALDNVVKAPVPQKVENVSLVTFTDGLDIGSWRMNSNYPSEALYLEAVNKQIHRTCIDGVKLDAYAIGVKGSDVTDITRFENDLYQLASEPDNVYSVTNMDEVNAKFREIAAKIYSTKVIYSLTIKLPAPDPGSVIRFTFDDVTDAKKSIYYIEGTYDYDFNNGVGVLKNVSYSGIRCNNGSTWVSIPSGIFDLFTINNLTNSLGEKVSTSTMKQWAYIPSSQSWQVNSEFSPSSNSTSTEEHSSAIVMLVLDCSSSLSSDFSKMQTAAKTFLGILAGQGDITTPTVSKATFTLGDLQVTMKASVSGTGNLSIVDKGFCISENQNMDNAKFYSTGDGTANFTYILKNLVAGKTYYCRSYAENQLGRSFGTISSFTAIEYTLPTVTTSNISNITASEATCGGNVTFDGYTSVTERGICWSTNPNPTISDNVLVLGSGTGSFSGTLQNLTDGTTYYVRAYAKNSKGVDYGPSKSFTTLSIVSPTVITSDVSNITANSANCGGQVTYDGRSTVIERGICWSKTPNPTINDSILVLGSGRGVFSGTLQNITDGTTYYVRAYAKNNKCIGYGEEKSFTTLSIVSPTVITSDVSNITINSAVSGGSISSDGNSEVVERGICWSKTPNPTINDSILVLGSGRGVFSGTLQNLTDGTTYYVRAYAKNNKCIGYGDGKSFTTIAIVAPTLTTAEIANITDSNAVCGGTISSDGNSEVIERGLCWSTNPNPTISDSVLVLGSGTGSFSGTMQNLKSGTTYYVRAYAKNNKYIEYGEEKSFTTVALIISLSGIDMINANSAKCTGVINTEGNPRVLERGFCWSTSPNPTIDNNVITAGSGTGTFTGNISNLELNTTYYVRAYAKNREGVSYSQEILDVYNSALCYSATTKLAETTSSTAEGIYTSNLEVPILSHTFTSGTGTIVFKGKLTKLTDNMFYQCTNLLSITIPNTVISIGSSAFCGCTSLTSVTIPNSVTEIGGSAFKGCTSLTSVSIGNSVTSVGWSAFEDCSSLTSFKIPNSVTYIWSYGFRGCTGLTSITIPNSVTRIDGYAFSGCTGLTSVIIPNSVTQIGMYAFSGCSGLEKVNITDLTAWCNISFYSDDSNPLYYAHHLYLQDIEVIDLIIPNNLTRIGSSAFCGCNGLTSVTIPNSVTEIGDGAFRDCTGMTSVIIPNSVTSIGDGAFRDCIGLPSVTIPNSVTSIGSNALSGCTGLTSVAISNGITSIGSSAFSGCTSLTSVTIPNSVTKIGGSAFKDCTGLTSVTLSNGITEISSNIFFGCTSLTSVTIPGSVTRIWDSAFDNCRSLTSVTIPNSVTSIMEKAFYWCTGLTSVNIGNSVIIIGVSAFHGCKGLTTIRIPESVASIGNYAFSGCTGLKSMTCLNTYPPSCQSSAFSLVSTSIPVYVPASAVSKYKKADVWKKFTNIQAISE